MVVSYRLSIVTVAPSATIRPQFAIECLRRSNQQGHFGPKFRGVPLGADPSCWGCKERTSQAILTVKLFSKNSNLCDHNPPTSQTDGQTDRQTTCDRNTALCTKVHRAVKTVEVRILKFSPYNSPTTLVLRGKFYPEILRGSPSGCVKQGRGG